MTDYTLVMQASINQGLKACEMSNWNDFDHEDVRAVAISIFIQKSKEGNITAMQAKPYAGAGSGKPFTPRGDAEKYGVCKDCGAPNAESKAGKRYCSKLCWKES